MANFASVVSASTASTDIQLTPDVSGDNTVLIVCWTGRADDSPTAMTQAGEALTKYSTTAGSSNSGFELWWVGNPAAGTLSVQTTLGATAASVIAVTVADADTVDPFSADTDSDPSSNHTYNISSSPGELVVDFLGGYNNTGLGFVTYPTATQSGQTTVSTTAFALETTTNSACLNASYKIGAASVTMGWETGVDSQAARILAVSVRDAAVTRTRSVKYFHDINDPQGRIYDDLGRVVMPWELKPDNWIRVSGLFLPTSRKYASFTQDPELAYIEEVQFSVRGGLRIKTSRGELTEVLLARAAGGKAF